MIPFKNLPPGESLLIHSGQSKNVEKYLKDGPNAYTFLGQLHTVNLLLTPIDRGLKTLEGQNVTCSDVFFVYIGIAIGFTQVFQNPSTI